MSRVLLVCPEPLTGGQPAGIGIRFLEMARTLRRDGHAVRLLAPDGRNSESPAAGALQADPPSSSIAEASDANENAVIAISPQNLLHFSSEADVAVVQGHVANDFFAHARDIPTVVDLYDPYIVENLHYFASRGAEVFTHDHATWIASLVRGDLFLCASAAQRLFYLGALLATARLNPMAYEAGPSLGQLIQLSPFGVAAPRRPPIRENSSSAVLFGGIYDWYDPVLAIDAVALARKTMPGITLTFTRHPNPGITPQGKTAEAIEYARSHGHDFVRFEPWVPYEQRGEFFDRYAAAILTFGQSLETELSMRTRIYDFLWGGLPVVSSPAPGTDEILARYGAGISVDGGASELAAALLSVLQDHDRRATMIAATRRFVAEHQWSSTLEPLRQFCRAPRRDASKARFAIPLATPTHEPTFVERVRRRLRGSS